MIHNSLDAQAPTTTIDTPTEQQITAEIIKLWENYCRIRGAEKRSTPERKATYLKLGQRLECIKRLLRQRGRRGRWTQFLCSCGIDRNTADRAVRAHMKSLGSGDTVHLKETELASSDKGVDEVLPSQSPAASEASVFASSMLESGDLQ